MRIKDFYSALNNEKIDAALFLNNGLDSKDASIEYFTGFNCEHAALLVVKKVSGFAATFFVPKHEFLEAVHKVRERRSNVKIHIKPLRKKKYLFDTIKKSLSGKKRIGINKRTLSAHQYEKISSAIKSKYVDIFPIVAELRSVKTEQEISCIKKACEYGDKILESIVKNFKNFKTETDVSSYILNEIRRIGLSPSFEPIVANGQSGAEVHHKPSTQKLKKGFLIIDMGVKYKGYCSDITRTFYIGTPSTKEINFYNMVLNAQLTGLKAVKINSTMENVNNSAKKVLGKYKKYFNHGIGHGIGLDVHDVIPSKQEKVWTLEENNVLTVEPGIYLEGRFGIRIEDTAVVAKSGAIKLTGFTKNLVMVKMC